MFVAEGADILFFDSPADEAEIRRSVEAAAGRPTFAVLSPGAALMPHRGNPNWMRKTWPLKILVRLKSVMMIL
jgi:hypothetical protein